MPVRILCPLLCVAAAFAAPRAASADEPAEPHAEGKLIATVLGEPVTEDMLVAPETERKRAGLGPEAFAEWETRSRRGLLFRTIRFSLQKAFAEREGLMPTDAERRALSRRVVEASKKSQPDMSPDEIKRMEEIWQSAWGAAYISEWKIAYALWSRYGGPIATGNLGACTAYEATEKFLRDEQRAGRLVFHDEAAEELFWQRAAMPVKDDAVYEDPEKIRRVFQSRLANYLGELSPLWPVATVAGEPLPINQIASPQKLRERGKVAPGAFAQSLQKELMWAVIQAAQRAYAEREGLLPTDAEREAYLESIRSSMRQNEPEASEEEIEARMTPFKSLWGDWLIINWKASHALWKKHGGELGTSAFGFVHPFEAMQAFLREEAEAGRLAFHDAELEKVFWQAIDAKTREEKRRWADAVFDDPEEIERLFRTLFAQLQPGEKEPS